MVTIPYFRGFYFQLYGRVGIRTINSEVTIPYFRGFYFQRHVGLRNITPEEMGYHTLFSRVLFSTHEIQAWGCALMHVTIPYFRGFYFQLVHIGIVRSQHINKRYHTLFSRVLFSTKDALIETKVPKNGYHTLFSRVLFSTEQYPHIYSSGYSYHTLFSRVLFSTQR